MSVEFLITSLIVVLMPGTGVLYTLAIGMGRGFRHSVAAAFGCTLGIVPAAGASILGLAAIFHTSALAFQITKYLGVIYLLYMAWSTLRDGGVLDVKANRADLPFVKTMLNGMLLNVLNPKLSLFFLAFLPQFVNVDATGATATMVYLTAFFMLLTFIIFVVYGGCASLTRNYVISRPAVMNWMKRAFAGAFVFLGLRLAIAER